MSGTPSAAPPPVEMRAAGAGSPGSGPGGWCAILSFKGTRRSFGGSSDATTANAMDLTSVVEGLAVLTRPSTVVVHAYSRWLEVGVLGRLPAMKASDWTENGRPPVDVELWRRLDGLLEIHDVLWIWSLGPGGDADGIRAVEAARTRMLSIRRNTNRGEDR